ncbi:MAG: VWA domain-containing protein [Chloracidobacterium sp.]|nr:VWA domain-containing protein [Chloracidobacterium sp.]
MCSSSLRRVTGGGVLTNGGGVPELRRSPDNQMIAGSTAIWDAIWVTSDEVLGPAPEKTRRAIILLSDGMNTSGRKKLDDAVQAALKSEAIIYSVGIGDNFYSGVDKGSLNKILQSGPAVGHIFRGTNANFARLLSRSRKRCDRST